MKKNADISLANYYQDDNHIYYIFMSSDCSCRAKRKSFGSATLIMSEQIEKTIQENLHDFKGTKEHVFMTLSLIVLLVALYYTIKEWMKFFIIVSVSIASTIV